MYDGAHPRRAAPWFTSFTAAARSGFESLGPVEGHDDIPDGVLGFPVDRHVLDSRVRVVEIKARIFKISRIQHPEVGPLTDGAGRNSNPAPAPTEPSVPVQSWRAAPRAPRELTGATAGWSAASIASSMSCAARAATGQSANAGDPGGFHRAMICRKCVHRATGAGERMDREPRCRDESRGSPAATQARQTDVQNTAINHRGSGWSRRPLEELVR